MGHAGIILAIALMLIYICFTEVGSAMIVHFSCPICTKVQKCHFAHGRQDFRGGQDFRAMGKEFPPVQFFSNTCWLFLILLIHLKPQ